MAKKASRNRSTGAPKSSAKRAARKTAKRSATTAKRSAKKTAKRSAKKTVKRGAKKAVKRSAKKAARPSAKSARRGAKKAAPRKRASTGRGGARGGQLSPSTARARWIESTEESAERPGETLATRSHEVIQKWAEERGAVPATAGDEPGGEVRVLRFNFPGFGGETLREISWEDWFKTFDDRDLVFLYQEEMKSGSQSNFFRLDNPNREDA